MSDSDNIKILLRKFATRQCSQDEIEELIVFFKKETSSNLLPVFHYLFISNANGRQRK